MNGGCETCKHSWGETKCRGCLWDGKSQRNTHWESKEPFINKPCVSEQACHEDKMKVLEKIRAEIESQRKEVSNKNSVYDELQNYYYGLNDGLKDARDIIDKYMAERVEEE